MVFSPKLIARYHELKQQEPDCILLMQVGSFLRVKFDMPGARR
jgi:DNA mismatch repair ATPase MutS